MQIINYPQKLNMPTAVILGYFDGVHKAHRAVIESAVKAEAQNLTPVVFTFRDIPNKQTKMLLSTEKEKEEAFESCGVKAVYYADFSSIRDLSPEDFVKGILKETLMANAVYCGYNYRFGKGASADVSKLMELCREQGMEVFPTDKVTEKEGDISSTRIRGLLSDGEIKKANELLGREYSISGRIIHGKQIGRTMGTPTINIKPSEQKLLPKFGVYAVYAKVGESTYRAVLNIGTKPTVTDKQEATVEAFLLDFDGNLYGEFATVYLAAYLREERKFADTDELKSAILKDVETAKKIFK